MALYSKDGLRFENEEQATHWFLSTLEETTPLGKKYEELHAHEWEPYELQATGLNEYEMALFLDRSDNIRDNIFKRISYNTYGNREEINTELVIEDINRFIKAIEIAHIAYTEAMYKAKDRIAKDDEDIINRFSDFDKLIVTFNIEKTVEDEELIIAITDEVTGKQKQIKVEFNEYGRLNMERVQRELASLFVKSAEGKFNIEEGTIGDYKIDDIIEYAVENDKQLRIEIID